MAKKIKRDKNSEAVFSQKAHAPYINRKHLAEFFGLSGKSLLFAVAETSDGNGGVNITPIIAILGMQEFISLKGGCIKSTARAQGLKEDLYPAIVVYNKEKNEFTFKSSVGSMAVVSAAVLTKHFGKSIIG